MKILYLSSEKEMVSLSHNDPKSNFMFQLSLNVIVR